MPAPAFATVIHARARAGAMAALMSLLAAGGSVVTARAAWAEEARPGVLLVTVDPGSSGLDPAVVRAAVARELGVEVVDVPVAGVAGTMIVEIRGQTDLTMSFSSTDGWVEVKRSLELPSDPGLAVEAIALLGGNLARNQAGELLAGLEKKEPPPAPGSPAKIEKAVSTQQQVAPRRPELVSVVTEGRIQLVAWVDGPARGNLGVQYLHGLAYGLVGVGVDVEPATAASAALGLRLPWRRVFADIDVLYSFVGDVYLRGVQRFHARHELRFRGTLGIEILPRWLGLFAGGAAEYGVDSDGVDLGWRPEAVAGVQVF